MEQQQKPDSETKSWLPRPYKVQEVAADPKQRSHGMSGRIVQQIHVRSLFSLLVGTAVRDGSLYSAYSRNQTAALIPVPGIQTRERRQQLKQKQVTIMVTEAMHTWAAGMKEQLIKIEINMKATSKESLNAKVIWWDQGSH